MPRNKYIKSFIYFFLIVAALWVVTPRVNGYWLSQHNNSAIELNAETGVKSQSTDETDFEKYNKPAYFNIFKFICSFIPSQKR